MTRLGRCAPFQSEDAAERLNEIILQRGSRGMSLLSEHADRRSVINAARRLVSATSRVLIATGFYILSAGLPETDGPLGAAHLGQALEKLGLAPVYVTDTHCASCLRALVGPEADVVEFPIAGDMESMRAADEILRRFNPGISIAIERCGMQPDGTYRNMRWNDVSEHTAKLDYLFLQPGTICIGDGGNEIGMGSLAGAIVAQLGMPSAPIIGAESLILATVSNWGAYGLIAACSCLTGQSLLPTREDLGIALELCVASGAVDGISGRSEASVDGFDSEVQLRIVDELRDFVDSQRSSQ